MIFLPLLVISIEVAKTDTSFLEVLYKCWYNSFFYYS